MLLRILSLSSTVCYCVICSYIVCFLLLHHFLSVLFVLSFHFPYFSLPLSHDCYSHLPLLTILFGSVLAKSLIMNEILVNFIHHTLLFSNSLCTFHSFQSHFGPAFHSHPHINLSRIFNQW